MSRNHMCDVVGEWTQKDSSTIALSNLKKRGLPILVSVIRRKVQKAHFRHQKMSKFIKISQSWGLLMEFVAFSAQLVRNRPRHCVQHPQIMEARGVGPHF